ncbi:MAG: hypothetical protein INR66_21395 [Gordonia polyisoprenivorans]|nr:hypothetical protein [Gordonia polyisoprenivorans]
MAINACDQRIAEFDTTTVIRRVDDEHTVDASVENRWIVKGFYEVVGETGTRVSYVCTVTKTPGYDELSVDVPLRD